MSASHSQLNQAPVLPHRLVLGLLALLLVIAVPLFIGSPVTSDTSLFDVQAMTVLKGGTLYRDVLEPNLPGIVWLHLAIRSIAGWSSEAIRFVDLLLFGATVILLTRVVCRDENPRSADRGGWLAAFSLTLFYLTRNEWCHCQRDIWMMVPVSAALLMRLGRTDVRLRSCVFEGMLWGIAFWIKPHVAIPAGAVMTIDLIRRASWRETRIDIGGMISGGILIAVPGIVWLIATGAWDHFWKMMLEWNPEYLATGKTRRSWERLSFLAARFWPWWLVHIVAVPVAVRHILSVRSSKTLVPYSKDSLLSVCYLAWLVQTFALQHAMDYIHVPEVLLGICVLARHPWQLDISLRRCAVAGLLLLSVISAPQLHNNRLTVWWTCMTHGSTPEVREILAQGHFPNWIHLDHVKQFLAGECADDGDVTCLNIHSIHLHKELGILPASRYWCVSHPLTMYPSRYDEILAAVKNPGVRYVVVEEKETEFKDQILPREFPGRYPVIFQSGTYKVYLTRDSGTSPSVRGPEETRATIGQPLIRRRL